MKINKAYWNIRTINYNDQLHLPKVLLFLKLHHEIIQQTYKTLYKREHITVCNKCGTNTTKHELYNKDVKQSIKVLTEFE